MSKKKREYRNILIPPAAIDKLQKLQPPHNTNCIVLYLFYLKKCIRDGTNRIWCDDGYVAGQIGKDGERKGLKWDMGRVSKTKQKLVKLGFIKVIQSRDKYGHFNKKYIDVKHYAKRQTIEKQRYLAVLDEYAEEFFHMVHYFTIQKMKDEVKMRELENKLADIGFLPISAKTTTSAYSREERNAYNSLTVARKTGDGESSTSSFTGASKFDAKCSAILLKTIKTTRQYNRRIDRKSWIRQFTELRLDDNVDKSRIKKVLLWYVQNIGKDQYIPAAYSAKAFRDKFLQIEDAMNRTNKAKSKKAYSVTVVDENDPTITRTTIHYANRDED
jgi:hypothetical protein